MQTIIFDIGNVLLSFQPESYLKQYYDEKTMGDLLTIIFCSQEWLDLDLGLISIQDAIDIFSKQNPHYHKEIEHVLSHWTEMLLPIQNNIDVLYNLKNQGYQLYILSNFHQEAILQMQQKYDFFRLFDGGLISAYEHMIKPQQEFYQRLVDQYQLQPQDCLFIDDMLANVHAAKDLGMQTIHLNYNKNLIQELKKYDIIIKE